MEGVQGNSFSVCRSQHAYLDVSLDFEGRPPEIDARIFKFIIGQALKKLFGEVGASVQVDVLRYRESDRRAYLRVSSSNLVRLWSSVTLHSSYNDRPCSFRVYKVSASLASLSVASPHYQHLPSAQASTSE